jgi:hypothetical protein
VEQATDFLKFAYLGQRIFSLVDVLSQISKHCKVQGAVVYLLINFDTLLSDSTGFERHGFLGPSLHVLDFAAQISLYKVFSCRQLRL